jgi:hypothetical protein
MSWNWEPGVCLGPFVFGQALPENRAELGLEDLGWSDDGTGWESFSAQDGAYTVHVAAGKIVALECWSKLLFRGQNLVGLTQAEVQTLLGDGELAMKVGSLDWNAMGLSLWMEGGSVESASLTQVSV